MPTRELKNLAKKKGSLKRGKRHDIIAGILGNLVATTKKEPPPAKVQALLQIALLEIFFKCFYQVPIGHGYKCIRDCGIRPGTRCACNTCVCNYFKTRDLFFFLLLSCISQYRWKIILKSF
jgi:hypothetical protein